MDKLKQLTVPDQARMIVISDIHGELELFKRLLEKVNYNSQDDYLIINGDMCEKGSNSIGVVSYIKSLSKTNPKVHVTEGNCEALVEELLNENPKLINYLVARKHSIMNEWLTQLDYPVDENSNIQEVKEVLTKHYSEDIDWLMRLPTAIETEDYIFVHAGLDDKENWKETDRDMAITIPAFLTKSHRSKKYVIVGHWPVVNYSSHLPLNNPIIDHEKRIIAMDGGNVVKRSGQLNALIIRPSYEEQFSYTYVDHFENFTVKEDFQADPKMVGSIKYPMYKINPIKEKDHFTLCEKIGSEEQIYVKNEYIQKDENGEITVTDDLSCAQISVKKGEMVSLINGDCTAYALIKKDGAEGWVKKEAIGL
ncbi:metallophosphoesterase [Bacillus carboniphilus]|uniref:Metallophosphoesterase n=1 Tax=Bacillus carboniphilus TaxID=86663 RepID=A0ABY9JSE4_9BACI|nr:metallophosphoesterase [Bacillus carboniphilus]WLR42322.1 metallophosphoesterase [Bacillus carboniphilus]